MSRFPETPFGLCIGLLHEVINCRANYWAKYRRVAEGLLLDNGYRIGTFGKSDSPQLCTPAEASDALVRGTVRLLAAMARDAHTPPASAAALREDVERLTGLARLYESDDADDGTD